MDKEYKEVRAYAEHLLGLRTKREAAWEDLSRWICPWRGIFTEMGVDRYDREDLMRFTAAASQAVLRGASGMTSGMTPRNISWFKPTFADPDLMELPGVRIWLDRVDERMKDCLAGGGFYQAIQNFNIDLIWAGCGLIYTEKGYDTPLTYESVQIGTFCVATSRYGKLAGVLRRIVMSVHELAKTFGEENLARPTKTLLNREPFKPVAIYHLVRPGKGRQAYDSLWWEEDGTGFLRKGGYAEMPYFFTVWNEGATVYGTGPGDDALADARQMDLLERQKLAALAKLINPPVKASPSLKEALDLEPGGINYMTAGEFCEPLFNLAPFAGAFKCIQEEIAAVAKRLEVGLMAAIFASIPLEQRPRDMSATEFLERKREALQQLGPVISAYEPTVLTPLLYRTAITLDRDGFFPPLPQTLANMNPLMKMEFISPMANALRQTGAETARALFGDVAQMYQATQQPQIFDKIDLDQLVDELATGLGAPGSIIRPDQVVENIREQRQQAQQEQLRQQQTREQEELAAKSPKPTADELAQLQEIANQENMGHLSALLGGE